MNKENKYQKELLIFASIITVSVVILAVLIVEKVNNETIRKPFAANFYRDAFEAEDIKLVNIGKDLAQETSNIKVEDANTVNTIETVATDKVKRADSNNDSVEKTKFVFSGNGQLSVETESNDSDKQVVLQNSAEITEKVKITTSSDRINEEIFKKAGLETIALNEEKYNSKIFDVNFKEFSAIKGKFINFTDTTNNSNFGYVVELGVDSTMLRDEVYALLKSKLESTLGNQINENNDSGLNSFYVKISGREGWTFYVVKMERAVYAFAYLENYQGTIKKLINNI